MTGYVCNIFVIGESLFWGKTLMRFWLPRKRRVTLRVDGFSLRILSNTFFFFFIKNSNFSTYRSPYSMRHFQFLNFDARFGISKLRDTLLYPKIVDGYLQNFQSNCFIEKEKKK